MQERVHITVLTGRAMFAENGFKCLISKFPPKTAILKHFGNIIRNSCYLVWIDGNAVKIMKLENILFCCFQLGWYREPSSLWDEGFYVFL